MTLATRMAFGEELLKIAESHDGFVVCSADTKACGLEHFGERFPGREVRVGIAEQNLVGIAAGLASCKRKVYLATFAVFASMRACEQVRTFVCYPRLNVTVIGTHAGLQVGGDGATHAAIEDVSIMRAFPNMTVIQPSDEAMAREIARASVDFEGPLYIRLHRNPVPDVVRNEKARFCFGKAEWIRNYGSDVAIIASGILLGKAVTAAENLEQTGIHVQVIEMATIKPIDRESIVKAARETRRIVTVEDHTVLGGLGSAVAEVVSEEYPVPVKRIGIQDRFTSSGDPELLYQEHHMTAEDIEYAVRQLTSCKRRKNTSRDMACGQ